MAIIKNEFPTSGVPTVPTDYSYQNEYIERNSRGYNAVSLTNWDGTTTKPQIAAGSVIEINGASWDITTATDIDTSGATSGTIYLYFDDGTPEFKFLDTAPTWSDTLNGWYTSGDRFTGHLITWDGSSSYTKKREYARNTQSGDIIITTVGGNIDAPTINSVTPGNWEGTYSSQSVNSAGWVIPAGAYMVANPDIDIDFEIYTGSGWVGATTSLCSGFFVSDGVNYRFIHNSASSGTIYYRKIW